ncbi:5-methylcytosine rRNA methyltransferase NSUN4-like protein [Leptotrombidium deliense]|uniref:NOL1/NOP2/Sun domain family member 4 n=1 Tax=Leptotrombidium deliense TaxID=299467 RepID=A0A443SKX0_9ACAR|nr:5-methylcytosine rRNA methyltransferase NSUN4-like protein [Leptotrombidium deliense]
MNVVRCNSFLKTVRNNICSRRYLILPPLVSNHNVIHVQTTLKHLQQKNSPRNAALTHFDNFYGKVYDKFWKSIRLGLLTPRKYCAVVNLFGDYEEVESELRSLGAIDVADYYQKHYKYAERYRLRMKIVAEKKAKKRAAIAAERGIPEEDVDSDLLTVSDISESEFKGKNLTGGSEAEDIVEMFATDISKQKGEFVNQASLNIDLNDFVPATEFKQKEEIITDSPYYEFYESNVDVPVTFTEQNRLNFPENIRVFTFRRRSLASFPEPQYSKGLNLLNYYLMDGASVLPVLALDLEVKDTVGDFCAAPGGKALTTMLTMKPSVLFCNDSSAARLARLKQIFKSYIPTLNGLEGVVRYSLEDAATLHKTHSFDKVLVDVPCTNDRVSALEDENNWFKISRTKERAELPHTQMSLLVSGLKSLKPGGTLVYSTCSLSPIQNDGVVHMSLKRMWEETNSDFEIVNLKEAFRPLRGLYKFHSFKYGQQVLPFICSNFGPMYISKIKRKP